MNNILLFPLCASSPSDIEAREQETGRVAVRQRGSKNIIRLIPQYQLRIREVGRKVAVSFESDCPGAA